MAGMRKKPSAVKSFVSSFDWYQPFNIPPLEGIKGRFGLLDRELINPALLPRDLRNKSFLEIGCNTGKYTLEAKLRGAEKVFGVDPDERWIERAKEITKILNLKGITYLKMSGEEIDELGTFDFVAMFSVIHLKSVSNPLILLKKAYAATNQVFITEIFTRFFWRNMHKFGYNIFLKHPIPTRKAFGAILKYDVGFKEVEFAGKNKNGRDLFVCYK